MEPVIPFELMDHQKKALETLGNGKILYGGVGSGKSATALAYYAKNEAPKNLYIITTAMKRNKLEWESDAVKLGISRDSKLSAYGPIVVDSWNNAHKYTDVEDAFFIFDEQRVVGTGAWAKSFIKIAKKNNWILLSATPGDTWLDYTAVFVANGFYRNPTQFKQEHVVYAPYVKFPKVMRYLGVDQLERYRNMVLVEMPYKKHTKRHEVEIDILYDEDEFQRIYKDRWHIYEDRPIEDVGELFRVVRKLTGTDPMRTDVLRSLMDKHPKLVVFYNFNYELDILRGFASEIPIGEYNGHQKDPIPDTDRWLYLVQYTAGAEGWNCTDTDAMVFWSLNYSYKTFEQAKGRIDRLDTPFIDLWYYIMKDNSIVGKAIRNSLLYKQNFNESAWASKNW